MQGLGDAPNSEACRSWAQPFTQSLQSRSHFYRIATKDHQPLDRPFNMRKDKEQNKNKAVVWGATENEGNKMQIISLKMLRAIREASVSMKKRIGYYTKKKKSRQGSQKLKK